MWEPWRVFCWRHGPRALLPEARRRERMTYDVKGTTSVPLLEARGPVLLFGGCYSNAQATQALLQAGNSFGIPPDHIVCTGDVVAYRADTAETVELVRAAGGHVVMGNCQE